MRRFSLTKILFLANVTWTISLVFSWVFTLNSEKSFARPRDFVKDLNNANVLQDRERLATIKHTLIQKYPNDKELILTYFDEHLPFIYGVTPTYTRLTQKADLTRLCQSFLHIPNFFWIVVEDSDSKTNLVSKFLKGCGIPYAHLNAKTETRVKLKDSDPNWLMPRGVAQRNEGLRWLRENVERTKPAVLYFIDDDNTYSLRLFEEMRFTKRVAVWPVGIVGGLKFEGPLCENGKVTSWYTAWKPERPFPIDMAGFAVNTKLVFQHPDAVFSNDVARGFQESHFLTKLVTKDDLETKANDCSEILVWHTRTEKPNMKQELKLQKIGKASDPKMEV